MKYSYTKVHPKRMIISPAFLTDLEQKNRKMKLSILTSFAEKKLQIFSLLIVVLFSVKSFAQKLEKMPVDLETDFALSSMPAHMRSGATVYLLDPEKGYYIGRQGTNGFICYVVRTEWEWAESRIDLATPISYDAEGAKTIFPASADVEAMRASGKYTPAQIKEIMTDRFSKGYYKAPSRPGISYMIGPIMRTHPNESPNVVTMSIPHYMFYAPYLSQADIGGTSPSGGPIILGEGPHGYIIVPVGVMEKAKIIEENKELLQRLENYRPYFKVESKSSHH